MLNNCNVTVSKWVVKPGFVYTSCREGLVKYVLTWRIVLKSSFVTAIVKSYMLRFVDLKSYLTCNYVLSFSSNAKQTLYKIFILSQSHIKSKVAIFVRILVD
jgi:hypothetical protein